MSSQVFLFLMVFVCLFVCLLWCCIVLGDDRLSLRCFGVILLVFVSGWFGIYSIHFDKMDVSTIGDTFHFHWTMGPWSYGRVFSPEKIGGDKESDAISKQPHYPIIPVNSNRQTGEHDFHSPEVPTAKKRNRSAWILLKSPNKSQETSWLGFCCKKKHHLKPNDVCHTSYIL